MYRRIDCLSPICFLKRPCAVDAKIKSWLLTFMPVSVCDVFQVLINSPPRDELFFFHPTSEHANTTKTAVPFTPCRVS